MEPSGKERRQAKRLPISAEGMLTIMVPEETFTPQQLRCIATDISLSGMRVKSYQITKTDYLQLLKGVRNAKVALDLPYLNAPIQLRAQIVWVEYHDGTSGGDKTHAVLGLSFSRMEPDTLPRLEYVIDRLNSESSRSDV